MIGIGELIEKWTGTEIIDRWHHTSTDHVFEAEETGAGYKVWFWTAYVETHEETGEKRVRLRYKVGPKFYTETDWQLATTLSEESEYDTVLMRGRHDPTFPRDEYVEKITQ